MKKIIFLGFIKCKTEKNKFLKFYLGIMENEKKIGIYIFFVIFQLLEKKIK